MRKIALGALAWAVLILAVVAVAGCATPQPPRTEYVEVKTPVPVYCVTRDRIPDEPAKVGDQLTGNAAADIGPVAILATELRKALRIARALLIACVKPEGN